LDLLFNGFSNHICFPAVSYTHLDVYKRQGLDRTGYGIHGTPEPELVGRTESHGCFRLANWDALTLIGLVHVGMPVSVEP